VAKEKSNLRDKSLRTIRTTNINRGWEPSFFRVHIIIFRRSTKSALVVHPPTINSSRSGQGKGVLSTTFQSHDFFIIQSFDISWFPALVRICVESEFAANSRAKYKNLATLARN